MKPQGGRQAVAPQDQGPALALQFRSLGAAGAAALAEAEGPRALSSAKQEDRKWWDLKIPQGPGGLTVSFVVVATTVLPRKAAQLALHRILGHAHRPPGPSRPGQAPATLGRQGRVGAGRGSIITQPGWAPGTGLPWAPAPREPASCVQEPPGPKGSCRRGGGDLSVGGMAGGQTRGAANRGVALGFLSQSEERSVALMPFPALRAWDPIIQSYIGELWNQVLN